jgi:hypothetical protein
LSLKSSSVSLQFNDSKTRGAADWCHRQKIKQNLSPYFWGFGIFGGVLLFAQVPPGPVQHGGGVELARCPVVTNRRQCFELEPTAEVAASQHATV